MITSRKEREECNAFYQSMIHKKTVDWYTFDDDTFEELEVALQTPETQHLFFLMQQYLSSINVSSLLSPKLWNDRMFLELYNMSGKSVIKHVTTYRVNKTKTCKELKVETPEWIHDLQPGHPSIKLKIK